MFYSFLIKTKIKNNMASQYFQTWRQLNPAEIVLAEFGQTEQKILDSKKVIFEILITFLFFVLFAYGLRLIDQKANLRQEQNQVFEFSEQVKTEESQKFYYQFQQGYVGQNLIGIEKYSFEELFEDKNLAVY